MKEILPTTASSFEPAGEWRAGSPAIPDAALFGPATVRDDPRKATCRTDKCPKIWYDERPPGGRKVYLDVS